MSNVWISSRILVNFEHNGEKAISQENNCGLIVQCIIDHSLLPKWLFFRENGPSKIGLLRASVLHRGSYIMGHYKVAYCQLMKDSIKKNFVEKICISYATKVSITDYFSILTFQTLGKQDVWTKIQRILFWKNLITKRIGTI